MSYINYICVLNIKITIYTYLQMAQIPGLYVHILNRYHNDFDTMTNVHICCTLCGGNNCSVIFGDQPEDIQDHIDTHHPNEDVVFGCFGENGLYFACINDMLDHIRSG
ncbi:unnamed protein product [Meganyctiphanes norvegica]|uniref:C2H2-type domain-containing protein n=1 Tax=Meganyctiphanes norvegica TaxID=48144 RepID=A0AAV2SR36_MEGNR